MSQQNVERLRGLYAEMASGNFRGPTDLFSPDFVYEPMADGRRAYIGFDAFTAQFREFLDQWEHFRIEAVGFEDLGDVVLVTEVQRGKGKRSGVETKTTFYATWTFRDGLLVRGRWDVDRDSALAAARA